ncbi:hypothetical protein TrRE_jg1284, partial [Triparma retinervis]
SVVILNKNQALASTTCSAIHTKFEQKKTYNNAQARVAQFYRNHCDPSKNWENSACCCKTCNDAAVFLMRDNNFSTCPSTSSPTFSPTASPSAPTASPTAAPSAPSG